MKTKICILFSFLIVSSCYKNMMEPQEYGDGAEYLIYQEILKNRINNSNYLIILDDSTRSEYFDSSYVSNICKDITGLKEETLLNYITANEKNIKLKRIPDFKFVFRSEYKKPQSDIVNVYLSKVGFDSAETQAVVTMGEIYGIEAGGGSLFILEKDKNLKWQITKVVGIWIA